MANPSKLPVGFSVLALAVQGFGADLGLFQGNGDIGKLQRAGSARYVASNESYVVSGGGANMWFTNDAFQFVWREQSGNFRLESGVEWVKGGGNPHRKACLLVRQSLAPDSPYVDVAVHGDGLVSLQFRAEEGGATREIQAAPGQHLRFGLLRQGDSFALLTSGADTRGLEPAGPFIRLQMTDPVYVGLGVCAHDDQALEIANFLQPALSALPATTDTKPRLHSTLETITVSSRDRRVRYHTLGNIEAPNWSRDGLHLIYNSEGKLFRLPLAEGNPAIIDTGFAIRCNNDHGLSPDGSQLVISDQSQGGKSLIYTLPATGGTPSRITPVGPSYWHGWSPDGKTLAYCAERNGEFDVYTVPATGGEERRLTTAKGLDDGPDYSPDGKFIYFNSDRTGQMHIWRMEPDGSNQEQMTQDEFNNWFPHPSPDGKWVVFLSYEKSVKGHPANQPVRLRMLPVAGGAIQELARLFGGQGTINVPSWSPDSRQLAFVSYELLAP